MGAEGVRRSDDDDDDSPSARLLAVYSLNRIVMEHIFLLLGRASFESIAFRSQGEPTPPPRGNSYWTIRGICLRGTASLRHQDPREEKCWMIVKEGKTMNIIVDLDS
jgi:hypothetical protein